MIPALCTEYWRSVSTVPEQLGMTQDTTMISGYQKKNQSILSSELWHHMRIF
jgi:hypothetical protein